MRRLLLLAVFGLAIAPPAAALDLPARKPGLWSLTMAFEGTKIPPRTMQQCIDAASEKAMNGVFGGGQEACAKRDIVKNGDTMVVDSVCTTTAGTVTTHAVVTGSFDSEYTVTVASKREGGKTPLAGADGQTHMSVSGKWDGPCKPGQKPGDMITNGRTINMLDLGKRQQELQRRTTPPK